MSLEIDQLVSEFVAKIVTAAEVAAIDRAKAAVSIAFGGAYKDLVSTVRNGSAAAVGQESKSGRPRQYCPVPGCSGVAAPIFGMVCSEHKNVAKSKIAKYRKERKLQLKSGAGKQSLQLRFRSMEGSTDGWALDATPAVKKPRKPRAKVLCPVPGCRGVAAPIFGMVCSDHRDMAKSKIAKYRKARKEAKKLGKKVAKSRTTMVAKTLNKVVNRATSKKLVADVSRKIATISKRLVKKSAKKSALGSVKKPTSVEKSPKQVVKKKVVKPGMVIKKSVKAKFLDKGRDKKVDKALDKKAVKVGPLKCSKGEKVTVGGKGGEKGDKKTDKEPDKKTDKKPVKSAKRSHKKVIKSVDAEVVETKKEATSDVVDPGIDYGLGIGLHTEDDDGGGF